MIRAGEEILLDYAPDDRTEETRITVKARLKEKSLKAKMAHARIVEAKEAQEEAAKEMKRKRTIA